MPRRHAVGDEAHQHGRDGKQEEERRADQAELLGAEIQFGHQRLGGQAQHGLVGEVDEHEEEDQGSHAPGPPEGPVSNGHATLLPQLAHETGAARGAQVARRGGGRHTAGNEKEIGRET